MEIPPTSRDRPEGPRCLGVDLGSKRIGLAVSGPGGIVSALKVLLARPTVEENAQAILQEASEYDVDAVVIGLPLNMDDTEGPQARQSHTLAEALTRLANAVSERDPVHRGRGSRPLAVHLHDERLTSHAADGRLAGRELTRKRKKARQDAVAAQILLESFLATEGAPHREAHPPPEDERE